MVVGVGEEHVEKPEAGLREEKLDRGKSIGKGT